MYKTFELGCAILLTLLMVGSLCAALDFAIAGESVHAGMAASACALFMYLIYLFVEQPDDDLDLPY
jgi:hypothetical protein